MITIPGALPEAEEVGKQFPDIFTVTQKAN